MFSVVHRGQEIIVPGLFLHQFERDGISKVRGEIINGRIDFREKQVHRVDLCNTGGLDTPPASGDSLLTRFAARHSRKSKKLGMARQQQVLALPSMQPAEEHEDGSWRFVQDPTIDRMQGIVAPQTAQRMHGFDHGSQRLAFNPAAGRTQQLAMPAFAQQTGNVNGGFWNPAMDPAAHRAHQIKLVEMDRQYHEIKASIFSYPKEPLAERTQHHMAPANGQHIDDFTAGFWPSLNDPIWNAPDPTTMNTPQGLAPAPGQHFNDIAGGAWPSNYNPAMRDMGPYPEFDDAAMLAIINSM